MKYFSRYFLCALLLLSSWQVSLCQSVAKPTDKPLNQPGEDADFQRYLTSGRTSVVAFYADWCPSCRSWAPILDAVNTYFPDMQVLFMDIGEWDTPVTEKYDVQSVPHFKIYNGVGSLIVEGPAAKDWLRQAIAQRLEARARGANRLNGPPTRLNVNAAARSVTTRPRTGTTKAQSRTTNGGLSRGERIESTGPLPSVDQVINRYVEVLGGINAVGKFQSRSAKGKVSISTLGRGSFVTYAKAPNKVLTTIEIPEVGVLKQGFNGATGWTQTPRSGVRAASAAELDTLKRDAVFHNLITLRSRFAQMRILGIAKIGYREAYVLEGKPAAGDPEKLYFSKDNGLLIRWDAVLNAVGVRTVAEVYLDDWTDVDGIKVPFTVTQLFPRLSIVYSLNEVKHDVQINDVVFNKPGTR
jgi:thiol-disulfide isomerase/thioredoxin